MKQNNCTSNTAAQQSATIAEDFFTGNFSRLPESTAEPKGKILSWNWEPMQESYAFKGKRKVVAWAQ